MKTISINKLQSEISKVTKEVEAGESYQVMRYSKALAYLIPKAKYEELVSQSSCKECVEDLRKISHHLNKK